MAYKYCLHEAIANTSEDLKPTKTSGVIKWDYEYKRLGTVSLLNLVEGIYTVKTENTEYERGKTNDGRRIRRKSQ